MAGFLSWGAGAAAGNQQVFENMIKDRAQQILERELAERSRHNTADEGLRGREIDARLKNAEATNALRAWGMQSEDAVRQANILNQTRDDARQMEQLRPVGQTVSPQRVDELRRLDVVPMESYQPKDYGHLSGDEQGPTIESFGFTGFKPKDAADHLQRAENLTVGGRNIPLNFDPGTGKYTRVDTGVEVKPDGVFHQPTFSFMPTYDQSGVPNGVAAGNTHAGTITPVQGAPLTRPAPGAAQNATDQQKRDLAVQTLSQIDEAINGAQDLIGPGAGRISRLEQAIGNPDPRVNALGTKLQFGKMQVDAALGGLRAAASPQLLQRWDNLLSQNLDPAALRASVQAMREIMQEKVGAPHSSGSVPAAGGNDLLNRLNARRKAGS